MNSLHEFTWSRELCDTSYARLFCGVRTSDQAPVVIKLARDEYPSPEDLAKLRHEHALLSALDLPCVPRAYGLIETHNGLGLVLEQLDGRPLASVIAEGRPSIERFLTLGLALTEVVVAIHRRGVLHKDLKPEHFFVDEQGAVKLIDFGLATRLAREARTRLGAAAAEGTFGYMSPEQTGRMNRAIDQRSDLYSLGVTLYELLTGSLPFAASDPLELVHSHLARSPAPPEQLRPDVPPVISAIVLKLLAKGAEDRYQEASGLAADLQRCLTQLRANPERPLEGFALGADDGAGVLRIPQKLYGRQIETAALLAAFSRCEAGACELLLLGGPSGAGKSALVQDLQKLLVRRGRLAAGKFDQLNRAVPYEPIVQACRELLTSILAEPPEGLRAWTERLRGALGANASVIVDLVPELELILGKQPPALPLDPGAAQHRFEQAFRSFVRLFSSRKHCLVLFFDDLQWADPASLRLLHALLTAPDRAHLLVIGGYRDNEVGPAHALTHALAALEQADAVIQEITLAPLGFGEVRALMADALGWAHASRVEKGRAAERLEALSDLAALSLRKTGGNPFFLGQFLTALAERSLLEYDARARAWHWDVARIEQLGVTDNVLDLLVERLHRLAPRTREVLQIAACVGHRFDLDTLATVLSRGQSEVAEDLWAPLLEGLIVPLDERYRYATSAPAPNAPSFKVSYEFQHDRVQQAAYSLIEPEQRAGTHLQIGRLLQHKYAGSIHDELLFELVNHLNLGAALMTEAHEREQLARLNLRAGLRARDAASYLVAIRLLAKCRELLGEAIWDHDYRLAYAAHFAQIECEAASGNTGTAFELLERLCQRSSSDLDRAAARRLEAAVLTQVNRMGDAIAAGIEAARLLGTELPLEPAQLGAAVQAEFGAVQQALAGRPAEALLELPVMSEPRALAVAQILTTMVPAAFQINQQLFGLVLLKAVSLSLAAGNPPAAPHFYASYALLYAIITGDLAGAYRFGRLAVALGERPPHRGSAGAGELVFASFVAHWQSHISESLAHYQRGLRASLEVGDHISFGYCVSHSCFTRLFAGTDLAGLNEEVHGFTAPLRNASDHINSSLVRTVIRALETLRGGAWNDTSLDRGGLPERADLEAMQVNPTLLGMHLIVKTMALYFAGDLAGALAASDGAEAICAYQRGMLWSVEHAFYRALVHAALLRAEPPERGEALAAALEKDEQALRELAAAVPVNHGHKLALVAAERAALRGDGGQALAHFDRALALAAEHGFSHHEALINERYALFHLDQGRPKVARLYLLEAHHGYTRWGAFVKAHKLAATHPELFGVTRQPSLRPSAPASLHSSGSMGGLDLATAVRVTQTITSELMLDKLIEQLMRSLVESAGAQRGFLIVPEDQRLRLSAAVTVEPDQVRLHLDQDLDTSGDLATAVVHYVARTHEPVVLADAPADRRFGRDRYIDEARPKSILAVAMVHHGRLRGVLYLENNAAKAAFDPTRTELLQFLAAQAATAIENATLYEELERRVAERTAALASANEQLQASLKELADAQRSLIDMSRQAGMADVATSILHNVGNVLNSINVSASVVISSVQHSKTAGIGKLAKLLEEHRTDLGRFLTDDARGSRIPMYLMQLSQAVELEQSAVTHELGVLRKNLDHINAVVAMQQTHAKGAGLAEEISPRELLEDAIKLGAGTLGPGDGELISICDDLPRLLADRHKILQIVMNLLSNARDAVRGAADRRIILRCRKLDERLAVSVEDRGVGIPAQDLTRVFNFGFTTKKDGHGFGLHASALAATELGGTLVCRSDGPGHGATFTLEVPYRLPSASRRTSLAS